MLVRGPKSHNGVFKAVDRYIGRSDWKVRENSNMAYSLQGLNFFISSEFTSQYWLKKVYPRKIAKAHSDGDMHMHDLQVLAPYCCGWDLHDLLASGFTGASGKTESKPAKHFRVALGQVVNFFYTMQGESAGAQAISSFDTYLAPFIRYDRLSYLEVKQAIQEFVFNLNVPTRVGFQTPFTNLTFDVNVPATLVEENVIIGGKIMPEKYKDFSEEMGMINKAFAEVMMEGDAKGRVFTFPIPTYNITKDFDWDDPAYNNLWEMTAKYGIPYFSNFVNSDMSPEDARSMCCRLRLDNRELRKRGGGLFAANPLTGSLGVVTINLPRLGYKAKSEKDFMKKLYKVMDLAYQSLEIKRQVIDELSDRGLFPYCSFYLRDVKQRHGSYWKNHFNTIGINGANEACLNLLGVSIATKKGRDFMIRILNNMRERLVEYQEKSGNLYNLEASPAEGVTYRFAKLDKEKHPNIIVANEAKVKEEKAAPYYTNSSHLPVDYTNDIFEALELQDDLQTLYTGGTVLHGFIGERISSIAATRDLVKKIAENFHLPYYTITPTFSVCPVHGYLPGEHEYCPKCDQALEISNPDNCIACVSEIKVATVN
jgi:ribonucleoside-triphosphate reductase